MTGPTRDPLVVYSHLRWDFVYQRPQHVLSRLAARHRVLFVEEPVYDPAAGASWDRSDPLPGLTVLRPRTPERAPGFAAAQMPTLRRMMRDALIEEGITRHLAWLYTPMALPLAQAMAPHGVVYDCMDELSAFLDAPPELVRREAELLQWADLVFTGGPSLHRAKRDRHPAVSCFPSSVDIAHFGRALEGDEAEETRDLPRPRLGYYGVIDERIDPAILDAMARAHPEWSIVMVGPIVKIAPDSLPRHPNLHFLGQRPYAELPAHLAGWDVCLLPFALNDATRFISPTKTLEYMAAGRPIVSTPITDVAEPYGRIVHLAATPRAFVAACERALAEPVEARAHREAGMREVLARTSWDITVAAMDARLEALELGEDLQPVPAGRRMATRALVLGAGPTGLSAAYHLGRDAVLVERNDTVGGWCRSIEEGGFTFDWAGHIMFSNDPYVHDLYRRLLGDNVHWQEREAWIYSKDVYTRYPFQGALYGLPADVIKECIVGAIEARFGPIRASGPAAGAAPANGVGAKDGAAHGGTSAPANGNGDGHATGSGATHAGANGNGAACARIERPESLDDCCGDGVLEAEAPLVDAAALHGPPASSEPRNFEEFIHRVWGAGIARHFAVPYNRKLWAVPLHEMETSWLGGRVPLPDLEEMIEGALHPAPKPMGPNARFGYPLRGGFQALMNGFLSHLRGPLLLGRRVVGVDVEAHVATLDDGTRIGYEQLVSTAPLPELVRLVGEAAPPAVRAAAAGLRRVSVRCVNLGIGRADVTDKHWIYYPEDTVFHRIFVQGNASPFCSPPGGTGLTCEITYSEHKPLPCDGDDLVRLCVDDCRRVGLLRADDPVWVANQVDLPYAYVVYDHARAARVETIRAWLLEHDILLAGRYSEWAYYNSDHAFLAGRTAAEAVRERLRRERVLGRTVERAVDDAMALLARAEESGRS